jgi:hypothetical protein
MEANMASKFIDIDGKRHLWRDIVQARRKQLEAEPKHEQPLLFEMRVDVRPELDRCAANRYLHPSLFDLE